MATISFRPDDRTHERLRRFCEGAERTQAVEMRHAVNIYLDLMDLARLRERAAAGFLEPSELANLERRAKDGAGRVLAAAISREADAAFEQAATVEYPTQEIGEIHYPFELLLEWLVTGRPREACA